jgi:hypothetical protein
MSRSAIITAAATLFCLSLPLSAHAQREIPRHSIIQRDTTPQQPLKGAIDIPAPPMPDTSLAPGTGTIVGAVADSLHFGMLADAGVTVTELPERKAVTSDAGLFRIDSLPPGKYVLDVTHPVVDSLGIQLHSDTINVVAGQIKPVRLSIPAMHSLISEVCTPAKLRFGPGVILGRVFDAGTQGPATGTEISVAWHETEVNTTVGVRTLQRVRKATVDDEGVYRICGVPETLSGTLQAIRGKAQTAEVPIETTDQPLAVRILFLPPVPVAAGAASDSGSTVPRAVVTGKVTNAGGVPVSGARVSVQGSESSAATGQDGKFTLTGVLPGTQAILVRRVGYSPVQTPLDVKVGAANDVTVRLGSAAPMLSAVKVEAKADPLKSTGFERRRKMGFGRYLDLDQIKASNPTYTSDILRRVPGLQVLGSGSSAVVSTTRSGGCIQFMLDNNRIPVGNGQSIDDVIQPQDVVAVEFYNPVDVPVELSGGTNTGCALVVLWSRAKLNNKTP